MLMEESFSALIQPLPGIERIHRLEAEKCCSERWQKYSEHRCRNTCCTWWICSTERTQQTPSVHNRNKEGGKHCCFQQIRPDSFVLAAISNFVREPLHLLDDSVVQVSPNPIL